MGGLVTPDHIVADKATGAVRRIMIAEKAVMTVLTPDGRKRVLLTLRSSVRAPGVPTRMRRPLRSWGAALLVARGIARVIAGPDDFHRFHSGDVLVRHGVSRLIWRKKSVLFWNETLSRDHLCPMVGSMSDPSDASCSDN